jgi:hypothetical protein
MPKDAVTPLGNPDAARVTLPLNPPALVTVMVSVPLLPWTTDKLDAEGERVKPVCVTANVWVLWQELALVYLATYVLTPVLNAIPLIWRAVEVKPLGPVQLQVPVKGCGPRFTVDPEATVTLAVCCQAAPFT